MKKSELTGQKAFDLYASKKNLGYDARALCFPDEKLQALRLKTAAQIFMALDPMPTQAIDLGCGFGDLRDYLPKKVGYLGVEAQDWMVKTALEVKGLQLIAQDAIEYLEKRSKKAVTHPPAFFALGLVASMDAEELAHFLKALIKAAPNAPYILSWQSKKLYKGAFQAWGTEDLARYLGPANRIVVTDSEVTGLFNA